MRDKHPGASAGEFYGDASNPSALPSVVNGRSVVTDNTAINSTDRFYRLSLP